MPLEGVFIERTDLTPAEMMQVRETARAVSKEPWLVFGFRYGPGSKSIPRRTELEVYLEPDVATDTVRRGRVLHVEISVPAGVEGEFPPRIESTTRYAQIVGPNRRPNELNGKWDQNRPFLIDGEFDDETTRETRGIYSEQSSGACFT